MARDSLDGLDAFLAVADTGSFTAAARRLGVTPPAVSQAVRRLERRIGLPLFSRTTRRVGLTEAGVHFRARSAPALAELGAAIESTRSLASTPTGLLRLNVPRLAGRLLVAPLLRGFIERYPHVRVEVYLDDGITDIVGDGFDAGIRLGERLQQDMVGVPLTPPLRSVVVGSSDYLERRGRPQTVSELEQHDCIAFRFTSSGVLNQWQFNDNGQLTSTHVNGRLIVNDTNLLLRAARNGLGLAYSFDMATQSMEQSGELERVLDQYAVEEPGLYLYFARHAAEQNKLRVFIDFVRERMAAGNDDPDSDSLTY